jgi:ribosome-associated translation inhibitor RaiA
MISITFKNLEKSELAQEEVYNRIEPLIDKFPSLKESKIQITLEMDNSPTQPGPDLFSVKFQAFGGRYDGVRVEKSHSNLYIALADVAEHLLEKINRFGDKNRVTERKQARNFPLNE